MNVIKYYRKLSWVNSSKFDKGRESIEELFFSNIADWESWNSSEYVLIESPSYSLSNPSIRLVFLFYL